MSSAPRLCSWPEMETDFFVYVFSYGVEVTAWDIVWRSGVSGKERHDQLVMSAGHWEEEH